MDTPRLGDILDDFVFTGGDPADKANWVHADSFTPKPGDVLDGYEFKGGDPADANSWAAYTPKPVGGSGAPSLSRVLSGTPDMQKLVDSAPKSEKSPFELQEAERVKRDIDSRIDTTKDEKAALKQRVDRVNPSILPVSTPATPEADTTWAEANPMKAAFGKTALGKLAGFAQAGVMYANGEEAARNIMRQLSGDSAVPDYQPKGISVGEDGGNYAPTDFSDPNDFGWVRGAKAKMAELTSSIDAKKMEEVDWSDPDERTDWLAVKLAGLAPDIMLSAAAALNPSLSTAYTTSMGVTSAGNTYGELVGGGVDRATAFGVSNLSGVIEGFSERLGLDALTSSARRLIFKKGTQDLLLKKLGGMGAITLLSGMIEGTEEVAAGVGRGVAMRVGGEASPLQDNAMVRKMRNTDPFEGATENFALGTLAGVPTGAVVGAGTAAQASQIDSTQVALNRLNNYDLLQSLDDNQLGNALNAATQLNEMRPGAVDSAKIQAEVARRKQAAADSAAQDLTFNLDAMSPNDVAAAAWTMLDTPLMVDAGPKVDASMLTQQQLEAQAQPYEIGSKQVGAKRKVPQNELIRYYDLLKNPSTLPMDVAFMRDVEQNLDQKTQELLKRSITAAFSMDFDERRKLAETLYPKQDTNLKNLTPEALQMLASNLEGLTPEQAGAIQAEIQKRSDPSAQTSATPTATTGASSGVGGVTYSGEVPATNLYRNESGTYTFKGTADTVAAVKQNLAAVGISSWVSASNESGATLTITKQADPQAVQAATQFTGREQPTAVNPDPVLEEDADLYQAVAGVAFQAQNTPDVKFSKSPVVQAAEDAWNIDNQGGTPFTFIERSEAELLQRVPARRAGELKAAKLIAEAFRGEVHLVENSDSRPIFDGLYGGSAGLGDNVFILDVNGNVSPTRVVSHEILHALRKQHPDIYQSLIQNLRGTIDPIRATRNLLGKGYAKEFAVEYQKVVKDFNDNVITRQQASKALDDIVKRARNSKWGETTSFTEEAVADLVGDEMVKPQFWEELAAELQPTQAVTMLERVRDALKNVINALTGKDLGSSKYVTDVRRAHAAVVKALAEYKRRMDAGQASDGQQSDAGKFARKDGTTDTIKKRTLEETLARIPENTRTASGDITKTIDGKQFDELDPKAIGHGFIFMQQEGVDAANKKLQQMMNQAALESGLPEADRAKIVIPDAQVFDNALRLPDEARYWYERSSIAFMRQFFDMAAEKVEHIIDIVAATSGGQEPYWNLRNAIASMSQLERGVPVTVGIRDAKSLSQSLSQEALKTHKFGNFANTMQATAGLRNEKPLATIDLQMSKLFNLKHGPDVASDPRMYETLARFFIKLRDLQNQYLTEGQQPYESWQLQALTWVYARGTSDPDDYGARMPDVMQVLREGGVELPNGKIDMSVMLDPKTAEVLAPTSVLSDVRTATLETKTLLTAEGEQSAEVYEKISGIEEPWAKKARDEYWQIQRRSMRALGERKKVGDKKVPSILSRLASAVLGRKAEAMRVDTNGGGTFEGAASPNLRLPLVFNTSQGRVDLSSMDLERNAILAILGKDLMQAASAASSFKTVPDGQHDTYSILIENYGMEDMPMDKLEALGNAIGFPLNYQVIPNGWLIDINVGGFDTRPTLDSIKRAIDSQFSGVSVKIIPRSYASDYLTPDGAYGSKSYEEAINEFQQYVSSNNTGRSKKSGSSGQLGDLVSVRNEIRDVAEQQRQAEAKWVADTTGHKKYPKFSLKAGDTARTAEASQADGTRVGGAWRFGERRVREVSGVDAARSFELSLIKAKQAQGLHGQFVFPKTADELQAMRMFVTDDGMAGFAVKPDGEITAVFKHPDVTTKGFISFVSDVARENGGAKLAAFGMPDDGLPVMYAKAGFKAVMYAKFETPRTDWDPANGSPRAYYMQYVGGDQTASLRDAPLVDSYAAARADARWTGAKFSRKQTETPEFKRWFGDSKVVDAEGKPLVVYHGTREDFTEFSDEQAPYRGGILAFFSTSKAFASDYAGVDEGGNVIPVYLSIQSPFDYRVDGEVMAKNFLSQSGGLSDQMEVQRILIGLGKLDEINLDNEEYLSESDFISAVSEGNWDALEAPEFVEFIRDAGYDGIVTKENGAINYAVFSPTQIKSAIGNNGQFDGSNPDIRFSLKTPVFYSQLARSIDQAKQDSQQAMQWKAWLTANAAKLGVKADEIKWTGINEWLDTKGREKVSKADIQAYLDQGGVKVEEVMLSDDWRGDAEAELTLGRPFEKDFVRIVPAGDVYEIYINGQYRRAAQSSSAALNYVEDLLKDSDSQGVTKFGQWQLPGGKNYRELLLTLPAPAGKPVFKSQHFDQPNILAHVRFNERTDAEGRRVLFLEEIQSDYGQRGRDKGFDKNTDDVYRAEYVGRWYGNQGEDLKYEVFKNDRSLGFYKAFTEAGAINEAKARNWNGEPIPEAPFVTDTKSWTALALKRMIRYAADNGYQAIAWTTGEQQAERYNLAKQIDTVKWKTRSDGKAVTVYSTRGVDITPNLIVDQDGKVTNGQYAGSSIADVVGKDIGTKILEADSGELKGLDLEVGGEGMKAFYDQIVPQATNDVLKKLGSAERVGVVSIPNPKGTGRTMEVPTIGGGTEIIKIADEKPINQPGFLITEDMRDKAMPLFSRKQMPVLGNLADRAINRMDEVINGTGSLPEMQQYMIGRKLTLGNISKIDDQLKAMAKVFLKASDADKAEVYNFMTTAGASPTAIANVEVRAKAIEIKADIDRIGVALVQKGLLAPAAHNKYKGAYLPRLYLTHLLNDEDRVAIQSGKKPSQMGYLKARMDIPEDVRRLILGEIKDPTFLTAHALAQPLRDIAILDWLETISQNTNWVAPDSIAQWGGKNVSVMWLKRTADKMRRVASLAPPADRPQMNAIADQMDQVAEQTLGSHDFDHSLYRQIPDTNRYGMLRGMWVRQEIYDDLMGVAQVAPEDRGTVESAFGYGGIGTKATQTWKFLKVAANPPGQVRNFVSNMVMLQLSGIGLHRMPAVMVRAINDVINEGPYWQIAKKYGVLEGTFASQELYRIRDEFSIIEKKHAPAVEKLLLMGRVYVKYATKAYQGMEALGKTMKIMDAMEHDGMTEGEAALEADKWLFDYSLLNKNLKYLRNMPLGSPFVTYFAKVAPRMLEVATKYPWRFAPWVALLASMPALFAAAMGGDDDDYEKIMKMMPSWMKNRPHMVLLPWKDESGNLVPLDIGYFFPWSQWGGIAKAVYNNDYTEAVSDTGIGGGPLLNLMTVATTGVDPFTKRKIMNEYDPPQKQAMSLMNYLWDFATIPVFSSNGVISPMWGVAEAIDTVSPGSVGDPAQYGGKLAQAMTKSTNRYGELRSTFGQAAARAVGFNTYSIDPKASRQRNIDALDREITDVKRRMSMELKNEALDEEERVAIRKQYNAEILKKREKLAQYIRETR